MVMLLGAVLGAPGPRNTSGAGLEFFKLASYAPIQLLHTRAPLDAVLAWQEQPKTVLQFPHVIFSWLLV